MLTLTLLTGVWHGWLCDGGALQAEFVVAGGIEKFTRETLAQDKILAKQFTSETIALLQKLCQAMKANKSRNQNTLVFMPHIPDTTRTSRSGKTARRRAPRRNQTTRDEYTQQANKLRKPKMRAFWPGTADTIRVLHSGRKDVRKILRQNKKTPNEYTQFVDKILKKVSQKKINHPAGLPRVRTPNDYYHTEMLLAYAILNNFTIGGVSCRSLLQQNLYICSYKDMCPNCGEFLKYLSFLIQGNLIFVSTQPYVFAHQSSRRKNEQFENLKITKNFFRIAFFDAPDPPLAVEE
jgi:hypothetical protein